MTTEVFLYLMRILKEKKRRGKKRVKHTPTYSRKGLLSAGAANRGPGPPRTVGCHSPVPLTWVRGAEPRWSLLLKVLQTLWRAQRTHVLRREPGRITPYRGEEFYSGFETPKRGLITVIKKRKINLLSIRREKSFASLQERGDWELNRM